MLLALCKPAASHSELGALDAVLSQTQLATKLSIPVAPLAINTKSSVNDLKNLRYVSAISAKSEKLKGRAE